MENVDLHRMKLMALVAVSDMIFTDYTEDDDDDDRYHGNHLAEVLLAGCVVLGQIPEVTIDCGGGMINGYTDAEFKNHFGMTRHTFNVILAMLRESGVVPMHTHGGREKIGVEKHLLIALWYYANQSSYRAISGHFGLRQSSALAVVRRVTEWLCSLASVFIRWPREQRVTEAEQGFSAKSGMADIIGAIGCTHIEIPPPKLHKEDYLNSHSGHSVILQGVATADLLFTDLYIGEPGSLINAEVLKRSPLFSKAETNRAFIFPNRKCIVGDSSFPSLPWLIPSFQDSRKLTRQEAAFNEVHALTRSAISVAFSRLKGRFHRLNKVTMADVKEVPNVVMACCVLHNLCELNADVPRETAENCCKNDGNSNVDVNGSDRRNELMQQMFNL